MIESLDESEGSEAFFRFEVGKSYRTIGGDIVTIMGFTNEGLHYETVYDQHGVHRYTDASYSAGRVTGTAHDCSDPRNIANGWVPGRRKDRLTLD